ncbi:hypothetical protein [Kribbella sp. CA-294648]|uniref:hypothetical protein n=1 Tax=Kribbella sp. CA-294648 TaxID=3239948 RepID=UPI003D93DD5D
MIRSPLISTVWCRWRRPFATSMTVTSVSAVIRVVPMAASGLTNAEAGEAAMVPPATTAAPAAVRPRN